MLKMHNPRIIFVNPPLSSAQRYGLLSQAGAVEPPFGLAYMASATRKMGVDSLILDAQATGLSVKQSIDFIKEYRPDFLAITMTTMCVNSAARLAAAAKEAMPNLTIIAGGVHLSSLPSQTMSDSPAFDIGVIGEGEKTIEELLGVFLGRGDLSAVAGIIFRRAQELIINPARERIRDLDTLAMPAFDLLADIGRYYHAAAQSMLHFPTISLVTSRGCSGHCTFCDRKVFGNEIRMHSASYIVDMIELLQSRFRIKGLVFEDDNFFLSKERLFQMAEIMSKRRIRIPWAALSRIDTITEEKLKIAKSCGCWQVLYGVESAAREILDFYHKDISPAQVEQAIRLTKKHHIYTKGFFIIGNPKETHDTLKQTREFIMHVPFDDISLTFFTPYPGAEVYKDVEKFGRFRKEFDGLSCFNPVFIPSGISEEELVSYERETLRQFYRQPRIYYSYLSRIRSLGQLSQFYKSWRALSRHTGGPGMQKELVVNADDFGLCQGINEGIAGLIDKGVLGGVSLIPGGAAFQQAVGILKARQDLGIGVHLYLTGLHPVSEREGIKSLLNKKGQFLPGIYSFLMRYLTPGAIKKEEIEKEFRAQIEKVRSYGLSITHLDSHQYVHMLPGIFEIAAMLAKEYQINFIRLPFIPLNRRFLLCRVSPQRKVWQLMLNALCIIYRPLVRRLGLEWKYYSLGFIDNGHLTRESLRSIISCMGNGRHELVCHPGTSECRHDIHTKEWGYHWEEETEALACGIIQAHAEEESIRLTSLKK